ncbi:MAG: HupE/UreJ family protein [Halopseudomonas sabulinigri]
MTRIVSILLLVLFVCGSAHAHKASDSFLYWDAANQDSPGRLDIALVDLLGVMVLDSNGDNQVTWGELQDQQSGITEYLASRISMTAGEQNCAMDWRMAGLTQHSDGNYLAMEVKPNCPTESVEEQQLQYNLFFTEDPQHRALVMVRKDGNERLTVLSPGQRSLALADNPGLLQTAKTFLWEGMVHLWIGYDHIIFLLALMLPAVLKRKKGRWVSVDSMGSAVKEVALVVTAFTLAHSITLVMATLGWVRFDIAWIETIIALSIVAAAINIVWPFLGRRLYLLGFGFGLIHGFGFASVLSDFLVNTGSLAVALASFNIGVELAQLAIVVVFVPLIFLLRHQWIYQRVILPVGITLIACTGMYWVWDRIPLA